MGDQRECCKATLKHFQDSSCKDDMLNLSNLKKAMIAVGLKNYASSMESSIFPRHWDKAKKVTINKILDAVIPELAKYEANRLKKDSDALCNEMMTKLAKTPESTGAKVDATTARLTDTSKYTGAHKQRFDASGKGRGAEGREERCDNSGYVGNYKGAGTYDKK